MKLPEGYEVLESVAVGMDPAEDGFAGTLFELVFDGERYVLIETALGREWCPGYVPELREGVVEPLRVAGHSDGEIRALGEVVL